jgi:hypothetical protein
MISYGSYPELECALADDKHYFKMPITLTGCRHSVCKQCLPKDENLTLECRICGIITIRDLYLSKDKEPVASKELLKVCLANLFSIIENQTSVKIGKLKSIFF